MLQKVLESIHLCNEWNWYSHDFNKCSQKIVLAWYERASSNLGHDNLDRRAQGQSTTNAVVDVQTSKGVISWIAVQYIYRFGIENQIWWFAISVTKGNIEKLGLKSEVVLALQHLLMGFVLQKLHWCNLFRVQSPSKERTEIVSWKVIHISHRNSHTSRQFRLLRVKVKNGDYSLFALPYAISGDLKSPLTNSRLEDLYLCFSFQLEDTNKATVTTVCSWNW